MTMTLISTVTLSVDTFQFEFTNVPQTGTDLLIIANGRIAATGPTEIELKMNGVQTNMSFSGLRGTGSAVGGLSGTNYSNMSYARVLPGSGATSNTFGSFEIYVPNYTSSVIKSAIFNGAGENNATAADLGITSMLWNNTAAITSIAVVCSTSNMIAGSTASLYTITKA